MSSVGEGSGVFVGGSDGSIVTEGVGDKEDVGVAVDVGTFPSVGIGDQVGV